MSKEQRVEDAARVIDPDAWVQSQEEAARIPKVGSYRLLMERRNRALASATAALAQSEALIDQLMRVEHRAIMANVKLGAWMSAALDDAKVCDEMKADINEWFSAGPPPHALSSSFASEALIGELVEALEECRVILLDLCPNLPHDGPRNAEEQDEYERIGFPLIKATRTLAKVTPRPDYHDDLVTEWDKPKVTQETKR